ncbi:MAG: C69 family dipeptidase [Paludibacter sp.]|jgi:dipeptidase|nr:C69 family dipeptidase [Paludibacter sp.]
MIKKIILAFAFLLSFVASYACTNFLAGKNATVDGSTLISYNADSYLLFGALYHYPAANYPAGAMLDIREWDTGKYLGKISQVEHTYNVIGNINEHQLAIGETTFGGREELVDSTGIMDYGSLIYITLQRAKSAREAISVMTDLVEEYGYYSEGESFSIADPDEVWIMEMVGKGAGNKGALWVAMRIPDDCVSGHANQARITTFPLEDKSNCLYSPDVIAFAREKGWFSGKNKDFSFSDTYAPLDYSGLRICEARVWSIFRKLNPEMERYISYVKGETSERMPLWVQPTQKVSAQDFKTFMRDMFEGTEFDMLQGVLAGPFKTKLRHSPLTYKIDTVEYIHERPIATQQTGFTFVAQMRSWLPAYIGGILWFGVDDAASCLYVPVYCCTDKVPLCYDERNGSLLEYSATSAFWIYNAVANFAYSKYSFMMPEIVKVQKKWETDFNNLIPAIDKVALELGEPEARQFLTSFSNTQAENSTAAWKKLGEYLLVKYMDGNVKRESSDGKFTQNEFHIPPGIIRPGYPQEYLKTIENQLQNLRYKSQEEINAAE